ncbi:hypothetical protein M0R45_007093 [Rubus argutus]|uniref:Annexin n=1 Tax=Rubus argutus TaxID=59490 RepID=A0AAW1YSX6_RUBAR
MLTMSTQSFEIECKEIHDSWIPGGRNQLVRSLARRNRHERQQIRETYEATYGEDLVKRLQQHQINTGISPNLCAALSLWMIDQHQRDSILVREALGNDQQVVALVASHKAHHADVNQDIAKSDARRLFETQTSSGIQEAVVLELLTKRSIPQLKLTFSCYNASMDMTIQSP